MQLKFLLKIVRGEPFETALSTLSSTSANFCFRVKMIVSRSPLVCPLDSYQFLVKNRAVFLT